MKKVVFYTILLLIFSFLARTYLVSRPVNTKISKTYYQYDTTELNEVKKLNTSLLLDKVNLFKWDNEVFTLVRIAKLQDADASYIYTNLYVAQYDFALLSEKLTGKFSGTFDSISSLVLCKFFPNSCQILTKNIDQDPFSEKLSSIVMNHLNVKHNTKLIANKPPKVLDGPNHWKGKIPYYGYDKTKQIPWIINSVSDISILPAAPNDNNWKQQLEISKAALAKITEAQKKSVAYWAGGPGTITPPGIWLEKANQYMQKRNIPLATFIRIRFALAIAIDDAVISVFTKKYTYWIKRPNMVDTSINTIMPTPNHPSYPAGHGAISGAAASVLTCLFPENANEWQSAANEATESRVWGGIHYPIDTEQGLKLGNKVGNIVCHWLNEND